MINTDCAKTDGGAAACLVSVIFEVIVAGTEKLPGAIETEAFLFSKNLARNTFFPFYLRNMSTKGAPITY